MPAPRINMRKLKDALRLKLEGGQSHQQIAAALGISKGVVTKYVGLAAAAAAGLDWPAVQAMDEAALERRLLSESLPVVSYVRPDYGRIHQELRRKGVTLMLLWEEYCAQVSDEHTPEQPVKPWRYSQFCENYRQFAKRLKRSMRQIHRAGEKLFIDYAVSDWAWHLEMIRPAREDRIHGERGGCDLVEGCGVCRSLAQRRRADRVHSRWSGGRLGAAPG
jgi:hypothetical protein